MIVRIQKNDLNKDNIFLGKEKGESAIVCNSDTTGTCGGLEVANLA